MQPLTAKQLIEKYLNFFKEHGHAIIPGAPLVPQDDPSTLFISAGMHPLVPYLLGEPHPLGKRLADVQKCLRTGDIENVGDTTHHTFLLMLGNWSLGDYFKKESIAYSYEFLTEVLKIDPQLISVTVFDGDETVPFDKESQEAWLEVGIPKERIYALGKEHNWWDAGNVGPGGPDTEIFIDTGKKPCSNECKPGCNCGKYLEIWNNVFIEFNRKEDGTYEPLKQKNVDTGMGLARTTAVLQGHFDDYQTELFMPIIKKIEALAGLSYSSIEIKGQIEKAFSTEGSRLASARSNNIKVTRSMRIVADHVRAAIFVASEGITPSKTDQGYVLRRLVRRAIRTGKNIGLETNFTKELGIVIINTYNDLYPELKEKADFILQTLDEEEKTFRRTLSKGLRQVEKLTANKESKTIAGEEAFDLYQSYGFPIELTQEVAKEKGFNVDTESFAGEFEKHKELSRTAAAGHFKGGLAEQSIETTKLHTATHLLNQALREILGEQSIAQRGSNITPERLRFDFAFERKLTDEEVKKVENLVNEKIAANLTVKCMEMTPKEAKEKGAQAQFGHKYGEVVKVYLVGNKAEKPFSMEVCGGPHVNSTGELGRFRISKQESVGKGTRRIKAVLE